MVDLKLPGSARPTSLICAFGGWNDGGQAATTALGFLRESYEATKIGSIDPEEYYDFTAVRPTVRLLEGRTRHIDWPENVLYAAHVPGAESDLLLFQGVEPSLRWKRFTGALIDSASQLGAHMVITLGALLADVPHTRPVSITGLASDEALLERLVLRQADYLEAAG